MFRSILSTKNQQFRIKKILTALENAGQVDFIFLDFHEAFDQDSQVNLNTKLRRKLCNARISQFPNFYFSEQQEFVSRSNSYSSWSALLPVMAQTALLGRPLFSFLDYLPLQSPVRCRVFADYCPFMTTFL